MLGCRSKQGHPDTTEHDVERRRVSHPGRGAGISIARVTQVARRAAKPPHLMRRTQDAGLRSTDQPLHCLREFKASLPLPSTAPRVSLLASVQGLVDMSAWQSGRTMEGDDVVVNRATTICQGVQEAGQYFSMCRN